MLVILFQLSLAALQKCRPIQLCIQITYSAMVIRFIPVVTLATMLVALHCAHVKPMDSGAERRPRAQVSTNIFSSGFSSSQLSKQIKLLLLFLFFYALLRSLKPWVIEKP